MVGVRRIPVPPRRLVDRVVVVVITAAASSSSTGAKVLQPIHPELVSPLTNKESHWRRPTMMAESPVRAAHHTQPNDQPPPNTTTLFSKATRHKSEAEQRILQALDRERQKRQQQQQQQQKPELDFSLDHEFPSSLPDTLVPDGSTVPTPNQAEEEEDVNAVPSTAIRSSSSLATSTRYLTAVHDLEQEEEEEEEEEEEFEQERRRQDLAAASLFHSKLANDDTTTNNNSSNNKETMSPALQRMTHAAAILLHAKGAFAKPLHSSSDDDDNDRDHSTRMETNHNKNHHQPDDPDNTLSGKSTTPLEPTEQPVLEETLPHDEPSNSVPHRNGSAQPMSHQTPTEGHAPPGNDDDHSNQAKRFQARTAMNALVQKLHSVHDLFGPQQPSKLWMDVLQVTFVLLIPCLTVAILLFYVFDNPPVGIVGTAYRHNGKTEVKRDGRTFGLQPFLTQCRFLAVLPLLLVLLSLVVLVRCVDGPLHRWSLWL